MNVIDEVSDCIGLLGSRFYECPYFYFGEADFQSELFAILRQRFPEHQEFANFHVWGTDRPKQLKPFISQRVHSEFCLPEGRIDLVVLDVSKLRIAINSRGRFGYIQGGTGEHIYIELKATRTNRSALSKKRWCRLIEADIKKLNRYSNPCFLVCFDLDGLLAPEETTALVESLNENITLAYFVNPEPKCFQSAAATA